MAQGHADSDCSGPGSCPGPCRDFQEVCSPPGPLARAPGASCESPASHASLGTHSVSFQTANGT